MLNQEQLAAIAAAMSLVQQTLQQNQLQSAPLDQPQPPRQPVPPTSSNVVKASQPISYSAVVAKSAGLTSNSITNTTNNNNLGTNNVTSNSNTTTSTLTATNGSVQPSFANNITENALNNLSLAGHNKLPSLPIDCNPFGDLDQPVFGPPFSASANHLSGLNGSDPMALFNSLNGYSGINGHGLQPEHLNVARYSLNHIANHHNTERDIFNTHIADGLGHTNGSLLTHHNSKTTLAHEPTLDDYAINHPTIPAHQLYNQQQNHSYRQNQMPSNNILHLQQQQQQQLQQQLHHQKPHPTSAETINNIMRSNNARDKSTPVHGRATNLLGFMGLYVGNLSPDLTKEQLEKIFCKYGEPVKAHRLIRSPVAFIKYENTESPRAAIDDLFGILLPDLTLNQDQPLKLHFDRNDAQLKANYRPTELPKEDNGECYGWRTTVCRRGKSCTKKHIPINRGIDFQMWMIKTNQTTVTGTATS